MPWWNLGGRMDDSWGKVFVFLILWSLLLSHVKKKKVLILVERIRKTLFKIIALGVVTLAIGERHETQLWIQGQLGIYSQEQNQKGPVERILAGGDIKGREFLLNWPNRFLAKGMPKIYMLKVKGEKIMSRVIRYQGRGIITNWLSRVFA